MPTKIELSKVASRERLPCRAAPYFQRLEAGHYLGYRRTVPSSSGTWVARWRDPATRQQHHKPLGPLDHLPPSARFDAAKALAQEWFRSLVIDGRTDIVSVIDACNAYVQHVADAKGDATARDLRLRFAQLVADDPLAPIELSKLKRQHARAWRSRLEQTEKPGGGQRAPATINRNLAALRAALNHAQAEGAVGNDFAWSEALKPVAGPAARREIYLSPDQRRALLAAADDEVRPLLQLLALLPLRPGAAAALRVADFDPRQNLLTVRKDKAHAGRVIKVPAQVAALLVEHCRNKLPAAPILARADGRPWDRDGWKWKVKAAVVAAGLPPGTVAYSLRHALISDLVTAGLDLASTASVAGTSVAMIAKYYAHLQHDHAEQALAGLAL